MVLAAVTAATSTMLAAVTAASLDLGPGAVTVALALVTLVQVIWLAKIGKGDRRKATRALHIDNGDPSERRAARKPAKRTTKQTPK